MISARTACWAAAVLAFGCVDGAVGAEAPLVAIDVGHSQGRAGAASARGVSEFQFNRALAEAVDAALRARGMRTRLIGFDGDADSLAGRTAAAVGADFFLSIHHDSVQPHYLETWQAEGRTHRFSDRFSGFSLFVSRRNRDPATSLACASAIGKAMRTGNFIPTPHHAEPIAGENRAWADEANGVYYFDDLIVLRTAAMPAVLVEAGIIVNRGEEARLRQPATRARIAQAIAKGLVECLHGR